MGLHKGDDYYLVLKDGKVRTEGGSFNMSRGEVVISDTGAKTPQGLKAVANFDKVSPRDLFVIKYGAGNTYKSFKTHPFKVSDVTRLIVTSPSKGESKVDRFILGYDGRDPNTAFEFKMGETRKITLSLSGLPMQMLGYTKPLIIDAHIDADECFNTECTECDPCLKGDCLQPTINTINYLKNINIGGQVKLSELVDIKLVHECDNETPPPTTDVNIFTISIPECGEPALADTLASATGLEVTVVGSDKFTNTYQVMTEEEDLGDVTIPSFPTYTEKCGMCANGAEPTRAGFAYIAKIDDEGADVAGTIVVANLVAAEKIGAETYSVITSQKLTQAELESGFEGIIALEYYEYVGETQAMCAGDEDKTFAWTKEGACKISKAQFYATFPLDDCGNILPIYNEIVAAYPNAEVGVVPANEPVDTNNVSFSSTVREGAGIVACQVTFQIQVPTDVVCPDCDPKFVNDFTSETPAPFQGVEWTPMTYSIDTNSRPFGATGNCKCGILFEGKRLDINPSECIRETFGYMTGSVQIEGSGGYIESSSLLFGNEDRPMAQKYLSRYEPIRGLGAELMGIENSSQFFFTGVASNDSYITNVLNGTTSLIDKDARYVDVALTVESNYRSQSYGTKTSDVITYHFLVKTGQEEKLVSVLTNLAANAGAEIIKD